MMWWAWVIGGAILLGAELAFIDAQFYLAFVGVSAIVVGFLALAAPSTPTWLHWALFAVLAILSVSTFRRTVYDQLRRNLPIAVQRGPAGDLVTLPDALAPGASCQIEYRGSHWTATNGSPHAIAAGARARITHVQGLALVVQAGDETPIS
jgi:membrane protein implicated in regulation of membrane protease activity